MQGMLINPDVFLTVNITDIHKKNPINLTFLNWRKTTQGQENDHQTKWIDQSTVSEFTIKDCIL